MALTVQETFALLPDIAEIIRTAETASKAVPADATDLENALAMVKAIVPPTCDLAVKLEKAIKS